MLDQLSLEKSFWPMLALDHGLTVGHHDSVPIPLLPKILCDAKEFFGSVVMTYGLARYSGNLNNIPLVIQCFGAPLDNPKVQICSVETAVQLNAVACAVQVDFSLVGEALRLQLGSVSRLVHEAHNVNLPVLFMVSPNATRDTSMLARSIRFCIELGADLIKVRSNLDNVDAEEAQNYRAALHGRTPVLLAGGDLHKDFIREVAIAKDLGFSGYCVGRNIFKHDHPIRMSMQLRNAWLNHNTE